MIKAGADNKNYTFHWRKKLINNRLVHPLWEFTSLSGKSWIRHCFYLCTVSYYTGNVTTKTEVPNQPQTNLLQIGHQLIFFRPQRSCGQGNIFTPVCHSVHRGGSASVHAGMPTPRPDPPEQTHNTPQTRHHPPGTRHHPPGTRHHPPRADPPPGADTPWGADTPQEQTPPDQTPSQEADSSIRSTSGRYASYWNAFLFPN